MTRIVGSWRGSVSKETAYNFWLTRPSPAFAETPPARTNEAAVSTLHIVYDPTDRLQVLPDCERALDLKIARLSIADDLESQDIYALARRLAELLLEQLPR
jgi:hypothetical protein